MPTPDFLKMKCVNTEMPRCAVCAKEVVIPLSSIEMFANDGEKAIILVKVTTFFPDPSCPMMGNTKRFMVSQMSWTDILNMLDGRVADIGNITLREFLNVSYFE